MGNFLDISGCVGKSRQDVVNALARFAAENDGIWEEIPLEEYEEDGDEYCRVETVGANTLVMYPNMSCLGDDASQYLAEKLGGTVFSLGIYDGDFWMFQLYHNDELVTRFNPWPNYFEEVDDEELESWRPDVDALCRVVPNVRPEQIERYLGFWPFPGEDDAAFYVKAYPNDEFNRGEDWQLIDFMRAVGLGYFSQSDPLNPETTQVFRFVVER